MVIGPLALGLDTYMGVRLLGGDFELPAHDKPSENRCCGRSDIDAEQSSLPDQKLRISNQHPKDAYGWQTGVRPDGDTLAS